MIQMAKCLRVNLMPVHRFMTKAVMVFIVILIAGHLAAQVKNYPIDISRVEKIEPVRLDKLGGSNPSGQKIAVNNYYITMSDLPIIPITGEMHYSRYPHQYWDESIRKLKAGGINMIATYVFWNIHEEKEGKFNWEGDRDLRKFVELCGKNHIQVVVRIGPFDHGEIRNGGIPDWTLGKPVTIRTNDPGYLHYVELLYNEIGKQLKGLYYQDGGTIVAVQLENEYQHSASPWGLTYPGQPYDFTVADRDRNSAHEGVSVASKNNPYAELGNDHMRALKSLAIKAGIIPPLYTATGWGYAAIIPNETLPVTAAYAYPTWVSTKEFSPFYLYKDLHADPDYAPVRYKAKDYPAFAAELGSGIMSTYSRRPLVPAESVDALINRCIGGGANGIGYYMYHGGSTPVAAHYFFSDEAYGYPKISYDFQAPVGEYGHVRPSYNRLKLVHFFINDFAPELAPMTTTLPENNGKIKADNLADLRYAVRSSGSSGFLFLNNFQDNAITRDKSGIRVGIKTASGVVNIPETGSLTLKGEENLILPFNFSLNGANLVYATAQLLTKGEISQNPYYVFFNPDGITPEFCFSGLNTKISGLVNCQLEPEKGNLYVKTQPGKAAEFIVKSNNGVNTRVLVISKSMALKCYQQDWKDGRHLVFTDALVLTEDNSAELLSVGKNHVDLSVYPMIAAMPKIDRGVIKQNTGRNIFSSYTITVPEINLAPKIVRSGTRKMMVTLPDAMPEGLNDLFLNINYIGDTAMGFLDGDLVADEFYKGVPWEIGIKRFVESAKNKDFGFYFRPIEKNAPYLADLPASINIMAAKNKETLEIKEVTYTPEYKIIVNFK